jgi:hypothetical protein
MTVQQIGPKEYIGLSTDTKPSATIGSTFFEYDRKRTYVTRDGTNWLLEDAPGGFYAKVTTIDLNQAAGDYDLWTIGSDDIEVLEMGFITHNDLSGEATFTGITIQSTDASPVEFIGATAGAKANLTAGAHIMYDGAATVGNTKKIELTITGGATAAEQVCEVFMACRKPLF